MHQPHPIQLAALLLALAAGARMGLAEVIYQDSLTGADTPLDGSTVDVSTGLAGGTLHATWQAAAEVVETRSGTTYPGSQAAFLPVTIQSGKVYTLTATVEKGVQSEYVALGFAKGPVELTSNFEHSTPLAWIAYYHPGKAPQAFSGPIFGRAVNGFAASQGGPATLSIELDTTAVPWKATFTIGSVSKSFTYGAAHSVPANFQYIGFGNKSTGGNAVANLSLTARTPDSLPTLSKRENARKATLMSATAR